MNDKKNKIKITRIIYTPGFEGYYIIYKPFKLNLGIVYVSGSCSQDDKQKILYLIYKQNKYGFLYDTDLVEAKKPE